MWVWEAELRRLAAIIVILILSAGLAHAHSAARGFVMLLPTTHVIVAGALAVLVSFVAVSMLPDRLFRRHRAVAAEDDPLSVGLRRAVSFVSAIVVTALLWVGFTGPHDPLKNLLVLGVWTLWWVVIVLLHPLLGNLWGLVNPFAWAVPADGRWRFPTTLAYMPAVAIFAGFAWFQLVYPAPEDPERLAFAVAAYGLFTLAAVFLFGARDWLSKGDPFAIFLYQLGSAAPIARERRSLRLRLPGAGLLALPPLPLAGVAFVLLTLSSISFDGFSHTFLWLSAIGTNPLEYPGRTAIRGANTAGLAASFAVLAVLYAATVWAGWAWSGRPGPLRPLVGRFVYALIPISIAYHFAHYAGDAILNLQYLVLAMNDPFETGARLLGVTPFHVTASFQNTASGAMALFAAQAAAIVAGHIVSVGVAHAMAVEPGLPRPATLRLEAPLALFMVLYTAFGLWLLATPSIG